MTGRRKNVSSRLRQRFTLQKEIQTADGAGGYTRSWQDITDVWAEMLPLSGKEKLSSAQLQSTVTHRVLLRYRNDVTAGNRLVFDNRAFNILYVSSAGINSGFIELLVEEGGM